MRMQHRRERSARRDGQHTTARAHSHTCMPPTLPPALLSPVSRVLYAFAVCVSCSVHSAAASDLLPPQLRVCCRVRSGPQCSAQSLRCDRSGQHRRRGVLIHALADPLGSAFAGTAMCGAGSAQPAARRTSLQIRWRAPPASGVVASSCSTHPRSCLPVYTDLAAQSDPRHSPRPGRRMPLRCDALSLPRSTRSHRAFRWPRHAPILPWPLLWMAVAHSSLLLLLLLCSCSALCCIAVARSRLALAPAAAVVVVVVVVVAVVVAPMPLPCCAVRCGAVRRCFPWSSQVASFGAFPFPVCLRVLLSLVLSSRLFSSRPYVGCAQLRLAPAVER